MRDDLRLGPGLTWLRSTIGDDCTCSGFGMGDDVVQMNAAAGNESAIVECGVQVEKMGGPQDVGGEQMLQVVTSIQRLFGLAADKNARYVQSL